MPTPGPGGAESHHGDAEFAAPDSPATSVDEGRLLHGAPDAIIGVRTDGRIEFINARVEALFGYPGDELIGKPVETLMPARFRPDHERMRARYFSEPGTRPMGAELELRGLRKEGTEFRCEISLSMIVDDAGPLSVAVIRDSAKRGAAPPGLDPGRAEELIELIDQERFQPVFQRIVDLRTGAVVGYEALTRFDVSPELGPAFWFEQATQLGLTPQLELLTIRAALRAFADAEAATSPADEPPFVSVNTSPETLALRSVEEAFNNFVRFDRIVVEVTEHAAITDYEEFNRSAQRLWDRDVRLAVDDVGAGYASLRHLLNLEPDFLKLDNSLTREIDRDPKRRAIASGLIAFAKEAECAVIAEGVETDAELAALVELGVQLGQGYWLGRPGPLPAAPQD